MIKCVIHRRSNYPRVPIAIELKIIIFLHFLNIIQLRLIGVEVELFINGIETTGEPCKSGFVTFPTNIMVCIEISSITNKNGLLTSNTASIDVPNR